MLKPKAVMVWGALFAITAIALVFAATSPLLQWRQPIYIIASFAGVFGLACLAFQPLLAANLLAGLSPGISRQMHRSVGIALVTTIIIHIGGLWITSPPDVIDALTFTSPTPFSNWGVLAMWAALISAGLVALRRPMQLKPRTWRSIHQMLGALIVTGTIVHALLIDGTMEFWSKLALCTAVALATGLALWRKRFRR